MIIGANFFGGDYGGCVFDTPICTDLLDELRLYEGKYDEIYLNLDTTIGEDNVRPSGQWLQKEIMDAKFQGDLDAGSISAHGFLVTYLNIYRSVLGSGKWDLVAQLPFNVDYNIYAFVDRYVQNGIQYQYAFAPMANEVVGDMVKSEAIFAQYKGIYLTDKTQNKKLEYDIDLGDITHNDDSATIQPLNGRFPITVFGDANYRSGHLSVLPLSKSTQNMYGSGVDKAAEQAERQSWIDFLTNHKAKVLRMDNGVLMLVTTKGLIESHKQQDMLRDLASLGFDYTEIGNVDFDNLSTNGLISDATVSKYSYDENGELHYE